jgi:hypothetical protein
MPEDGQQWPQHVACVDRTKKICCVWLYMFSSFNTMYRNGMNYTYKPIIQTNYTNQLYKPIIQTNYKNQL